MFPAIHILECAFVTEFLTSNTFWFRLRYWLIDDIFIAKNVIEALEALSPAVNVCGITHAHAVNFIHGTIIATIVSIIIATIITTIVTTIVASIAWQLVASAFPIAMLSNPFTYILLRICLFLEGIGICNGAYVIAWIHAKIAGFQRDEIYIGTAEERREKAMADDKSVLSVGTGHIAKLPLVDAPADLKNLIETNDEVRKYMEGSMKESA